MRTCKCGKAKMYCIRCGASLIKTEEELTAEKTPAPIDPAPVAQPGATPAPSAGDPAAPPASKEKWVRPSEVPKDRVRATSPSVGLSELEKAKATFAEADQADPDERMLRASEVRELMDVIEKQASDMHPEPTVVETPVVAPTSVPEITPPVVSAPPPEEQPVIESAPTPVTPPTVSAPEPEIAPPVEEPTVVEPPITESETETATSELEPEEPKPDPKLDSADLEPYLSKVPDPKFYQDSKIKDFMEDIANALKELKMAESDLSEVSARLDDEVRKHRNASETKRIDYEALEEKLRFAKQEWNDAKKAHDLAEKRSKKETATRQDRIKNVQKRLDKIETQIERRVRVLGREKEKED